MYIKRTLEPVIQKAGNFFSVIFITGPRQVGKTTIFENCEKQKRRIVSLDSLENRERAQKDPRAFLERFPAPVLIDEIQYAPQLFPYIKETVDREKKNNMYWITGSQQFHLMQNVTESLAGRVGVLRLQGLSQSEKNKNPLRAPFLPTSEIIKSRETKQPTLLKLFHRIWKGSYPALYKRSDDYWTLFYESYLQTYLERDVKQILKISNELVFTNFMQALAAQTAQLLNYASIAKEVGASECTIKSWVSVLQTSGLIYLLQPYSNNRTSRAIKTPKIYFMDTGLACYLTKWTTPETLESGAYSGAIFETYVVSEIIKSYWHNGENPNIYFYRDKDQKEVDVILEQDGLLYPIEIKKKTNPTKSEAKHLHTLPIKGAKFGMGAVICSAATYLPLDEKTFIVPVGYI